MFLPSGVSFPSTDTVTQASPYYLSGMVDSYEDLTRFTRYIPGVRHGPCSPLLDHGRDRHTERLPAGQSRWSGTLLTGPSPIFSCSPRSLSAAKRASRCRAACTATTGALYTTPGCLPLRRQRSPTWRRTFEDLVEEELAHRSPRLLHDPCAGPASPRVFLRGCAQPGQLPSEGSPLAER